MLMGLFGLMYIINTFVAKTVPTSKDSEDSCYSKVPGKAAKHQWVMKVEVDHNGYLICKRCGKIPGDD